MTTGRILILDKWLLHLPSLQQQWTTYCILSASKECI